MPKIYYKKGFSLAPYRIAENGEVTFTDGTLNDLVANQQTCEGYGYTYDQSTGTCRAFSYSSNILASFKSELNKQIGTRNTIGINNQNSQIIGTQNILEGNNSNSFILGSEHTIENGFNNSAVIGGKRAIITRDSEVAIGGGKRSIADSTSAATFSSRRQTSTIELAGVTIDNTTTSLTVQGDGSSYINVKNNSIIGYDIYITRLELGGSSGTAGNYSYRNIRGAVQIDDSYTMAFVVGFSRNIAKIGQNGTCIMRDTSTSDLKSISVAVTDRNNVHNLWSASVTLHEVISTTTF
jgi:hypothetical protein